MVRAVGRTEEAVRLYDTGHFALEIHAQEIAGAIRDFLGRKVLPVQAAAR